MKNKILLSMVLMLIFLFSLAIPEHALASFTDLNEKSACYPYVKFLHSRGIIKGYPDGSFHPQNSITRAEMAVILYKAANLPPYMPKQSTFRDIKPGHWAYQAVESCVKAGLIAGYPDGTFRPDSRITRAETVVLSLRLCGQPVPAIDMPDNIKDVPSRHWAYKELAFALEAGLIDTSDAGSLSPDKPASRAQAAQSIAVSLTISPQYSKTDLLGTIKPVKGEIILINSQNQAKNISAPSVILPGTTIKTSSGSEAEIQFPDGSSILVKPDTELAVTKARGQVYIKKDGSPGQTVDNLELKLSRGKILGALATSYLFHKEEKSQSKGMTPLAQNIQTETPWWKQASSKKTRVKVDMPWGVAAVRGTFWSNEVTEEANIASVADGELELTGGGISVSIPGGQYASITSPGSKPSVPSPMTAEMKAEWQKAADWVQNTARAMEQNMPAEIAKGSTETITQDSSSSKSDENTSLKDQIVQNITLNTAGSSSNNTSNTSTTSFRESSGSSGGSSGSSSGSSGGNSGSTGGSSGGSNTGSNTGGSTGESSNLNEPVYFADPNLEAAVRNELNKNNDIITKEDMLRLTALKANDKGIVNLEGLQYAKNLKTLELCHNNIVNIDILSELKQLEVLLIYENKIEDIKALAGLTSLTDLNIGNNPITDISYLSNLTNLEGLGLWDNGITNISSLSNLKNLRALLLWGNEIENIEILKDFKKLQLLSLSFNKISDISYISSLTELTYLDLAGNKINNINCLGNLNKLNHLDLSHNKISDISSLTNLNKLKQLDLTDNFIDTADPATAAALNTIRTNNPGISIDIVHQKQAIKNNSTYTNTATFSKSSPADITVTVHEDIDITAPLQLKNGTEPISNTCYTVDTENRTITISKDYLATLDNGSAVISFYFENGNIKANLYLTITGSYVPEQVVTFADPNLEAAVRRALNKPIEKITERDMLTLTSLNANYSNISNLQGLEYAANLQQLYLGHNNISDISPLVGLTNLQWLYLEENNISDISSIASLTNLQTLSLFENNISNISPLTGLTNLQRLNLSINSISNISPLAGLTNLQLLYLDANKINDIHPLAGLTNLQELSLSLNNISNISPLTELTNLKKLYLDNNNISNISSLTNLNNLQWLNLSRNFIDTADQETATAINIIRTNNPGIITVIEGIQKKAITKTGGYTNTATFKKSYPADITVTVHEDIDITAPLQLKNGTETIDNTCYTVDTAAKTITISRDYLVTLDNGSTVISFYFENGNIKANLYLTVVD